LIETLYPRNQRQYSERQRPRVVGPNHLHSRPYG
jgi:hypothetical protein